MDTPTLEELNDALERHPRLLFDFLQGVYRDPPKMAGPWSEDYADSHIRWTASRHKAVLVRRGTRWTYVYADKHHDDWFDTSDEAKAAADQTLRADGWTLLDDD